MTPVAGKHAVLLTAGRSPVALEMARQFAAAHYDVFVADTMRSHICAFSNRVKCSFLVASPHDDPNGFVRDVRRIVQQQHIDWVVPVYEDCFALARAPDLAAVLFAPNAQQLDALHNKWLFTEMQRAAGLTPPPTQLLQCADDLNRLDRSHTLAIKPCYTRAAMHIRQIKPGETIAALPISPSNPYVAQRWIEGKRFCSYSVCVNGEVRAHVAYPVTITTDGHSCTYFETMQSAACRAFVDQIVSHFKLTGQLGFDFIEQPDGQLFAIECNPRPTSGIHLLATEHALPHAIARQGPADDAVMPCRRQIFAGMAMYGWRYQMDSLAHILAYLRAFFCTHDVVFNCRDPLPFCMQGLIYVELMAMARRLGLSLAHVFLYDFQCDPPTVSPLSLTEQPDDRANVA